MSITASHISKTFGDFAALDKVSLHVPAGKLVALLGPSGSGKTTLLRIIAGLEMADEGSGHILFGNEDVSLLPPGKRGVGFVFQHYALFRHLSVAENIAFGLRIRKGPERPSKATITSRVQELLALVQLEHLGKRYPTQLSGGQRQRVALARALAVQPKVLLLDEPFGALDAKVRRDLRRWLRNFHDGIHITTLFVTHDQEEALEIADDVVILNSGRVEQVGSPQEVYDRPATPFVHKFLGNVNQILLPWEGIIQGTKVPVEENVAFVRPHDIELLRPETAQPGALATVLDLHAAGPIAKIAAKRTDGRGIIDIELPRAYFDQLNLREGDTILLRARLEPVCQTILVTKPPMT
ncbi:MAG: sulfate ABC transporter ATP-binding protein [Puniceicoccales bacterium]|jgi:sulfate transport system ATP-binding protein|nr:sulfate ABC transporter ATP-binding protein [Puniceicoccales bacterium]